VQCELEQISAELAAANSEDERALIIRSCDHRLEAIKLAALEGTRHRRSPGIHGAISDHAFGRFGIEV
jgi:hypothetical protein